MNAIERDAIEILAPAAAYGLGLAFPMIPSEVWSTIFKAIENGNLDAAAFDAFLAEHGLKTYSDATDYPDPPPQSQAVNNLEVKQSN